MTNLALNGLNACRGFGVEYATLKITRSLETLAKTLVGLDLDRPVNSEQSNLRSGGEVGISSCHEVR